ncbi:23S rRNA (uracil(1939)-C(5))-methyltransferase RlmD [Clostridiaceae bacterium DONG20-135]|uniref:23S rRNA (Uracil(1939)-C(5))-methyltransferase RlmD n=2 Tax=Copranaerobaculum intestinale TaxID=2692629 RepID=A0A6N8U905_9FIRM|nr:23S rRNA (uracil(1939)-C(5))-methyltransferase RlmD [Copranaerobaculum intestinale]
MNKNEFVIGTCENYTHDGQGVVKIDGYPIFVKGIIRGEKAKIQIMKDKKTYAYGRVAELLEVSAHRIKPKCLVYGKCGGCQLQHMDREAQQDFKREKVQDVVTRIAKLPIRVNPVLDMEVPFAYRNKGQIPVDVKHGSVKTGFYRIHSNDIVDIEQCLIQSEVINEILQVIKKDLKVYKNGKDLRHLLIKHAFSTGEAMVVFISRNRDIPHLDEMIAHIQTVYPKLKTVIVNLNQRTDNVILGNCEYIVYGDGYIVDELQGLKFYISSKSFYQINPVQTVKLYQQVLAYADLTGQEKVLDLYCGVGTISLFLAGQAKLVTGIEIVPEAIADALRNVALNNIDNVNFVCSDAASYAKELVKKQQQPDVIVVDPPRKGCDEITLKAMIKMEPQKIVYVSCDPATLARDLKVLCENGYEVQAIQPVDMFPQTYHVETVVSLVRKNPDAYVDVTIDMDELDLTASETKATYQEIKDYIFEKYNVKVSSLYIAQVKQKYGIIERENYNKTKSDDSKQPKCPVDKENLIAEALRYFKMI